MTVVPRVQRYTAYALVQLLSILHATRGSVHSTKLGFCTIPRVFALVLLFLLYFQRIFNASRRHFQSTRATCLLHESLYDLILAIQLAKRVFPTERRSNGCKTAISKPWVAILDGRQGSKGEPSHKYTQVARKIAQKAIRSHSSSVEESSRAKTASIWA